jgi:hypothetical protein
MRVIAIQTYRHNTQRISQVNTSRIIALATERIMANRREMMAGRLRASRKKAGYAAVSDAAAAFDSIKVPTLTSHENGTREFDVEAAIRYGRAFRVSPAWLLGLDAESMPVTAESYAINEEVLARLLHALGPSIPKKGVSEPAAKALAVALTHALALLPATGATLPSDGEIAMAVRAAVSRYREVAPT